MTDRRFLGSAALARVLANLDMTCVDIGARGGFFEDLLPMAWAVDAYRFEPDAAACDELNRQMKSEPPPWRSLEYFPTAIAGSNGTRTLYLTRMGSTSSMLESDVALAAHFGREDFYDLDRTVEVPTRTLDDFATSHGLASIDFVKLDIEGLEHEVIDGAPRLFGDEILGARIQINHLRFRKNQPLNFDIDRILNGHGFVPLGFAELHHWRRLTRTHHLVPMSGPFPYSLGQIAHGDMIYLRNTRAMGDHSDRQVKRLLKSAAFCLVYGYVDEALSVLLRPKVASYLAHGYGICVEDELSIVSHTLHEKALRDRRQARLQAVKSALRRRFERLIGGQ